MRVPEPYEEGARDLDQAQLARLGTVEREAVLAREYRAAFSNPFQAAERGYVDAVIQPADTRRQLVKATKRKPVI